MFYGAKIWTCQKCDEKELEFDYVEWMKKERTEEGNGGMQLVGTIKNDALRQKWREGLEWAKKS